MSKVIVAIDIGKKGAIVVRRPGFQPDRFFPMPLIRNEVDYPQLNAIFYDACTTDIHEPAVDIHVIFEKLGVIFGTGKSTAFSMGHQAGAIEMMCIVKNIPFTKISAKVWQKEMFQGTSLITKKSKSGKSTVTDTKATALVVAKQLFPNQKLTFGTKASKPHDGLVDALLMAEYAKRKNL